VRPTISPKIGGSDVDPDGHSLGVRTSRF
jgi:hypothetical protein